MSILIKGMEMPKNCWECEFNKSTLDRMDFCTLTNKQYNWGLSERPSDCPLVEVPPHGRLIDETVVLDHFVTLANIEWNQNVVTSWANAFAEAASDISDIPTVIPADKDGET